jgi:hypothetical protein
MSQALGHLKAQVHIGTCAHTRAHQTAQRKVNHTVQLSLTDSFRKGMSSTCKSEQEQLHSQAMWYVYSDHVVSKSTFSNPFFNTMMTDQNSDACVASDKQLIYYVRAEYAQFQKFLAESLTIAALETKGNRHAQATHDGVTLKDKRKYQALGLNFSFLCRNWTVAIGFERCNDGTNKGVADLYCTTFKAASLGMGASVVCRTSISDEAAAGANELILNVVQHAKEPGCTGGVVFDEDGEALEVEGIDETVEGERCNMHKSDKIGSSAVGYLVRSKKKDVVNPFEAGVRVMKRQLAAAQYYSYAGGTRSDALGEHITASKSPNILPSVLVCICAGKWHKDCGAAQPPCRQPPTKKSAGQAPHSAGNEQ